ncbi:hypothetical protein AMELA_G00235880 [Ameiurus melas]|uniref:Uncharacterized protein n=1 Tax=Ameiurus melas TaxID=219545 RepID=A0A7J5ZY71_AMEME|nr:hypothetical protein AMELA_G00235880 [Ameiurus melas]
MEIKHSNLKNDSYNGYSVVVGRRDRDSLVFSGAPRSNHRGQVTLFRKMNHKWEVMSTIAGEQLKLEKEKSWRCLNRLRVPSLKLHHFGLAIDGVMDMGQDGLTDIAVGAQRDRCTLERSSVSLRLKSTYPLRLPRLLGRSFPHHHSAPASVRENTNSKGAVKSGLNVTLELKAERCEHRTSRVFSAEDKTSRSLVTSVLLDSESCVKDTVSPVLFRLHFHQSDHQSKSSNSILNIDCKTTTQVEVPFQINCRNTSCVSDLQLDFKFL